MWSRLTTFIALLAAISLPPTEARSAGCGTTPPSGGVKTINVNGRQRQYTLALPGNYNSNTAYKLIFGYHWLNGNMGNVVSMGYYGLQSLSQNTAIFVAPEGLNAGWANNGGEDIALTDAIISSVQDQLCVEEKNIFATGFSYGGGMSYSVACSRGGQYPPPFHAHVSLRGQHCTHVHTNPPGVITDVFKAVAIIAGAQLSGCAGGNTPIPYLGIHGAADNVLPIASGRQLRDKFLGLNGCQNQNAQEPGPSSPGNSIRTDYSCRAGYPVTWIAHGGGHIADPPFAPAETWKFFTQQGLKGDDESGGTDPPTTTRPPTTTTRTTTSSGGQPTGGACASRYGQCGGANWSGPTCCESGTTCRFSNDWYSQCL